jgi:hypothetical protein
MTFLLGTWLQAITRKTTTGAPTRRGAKRTRPRRAVLGIEALEDRTVPSTLTVTNSLDTGVMGDGSLRGEIAAAAGGDTINFDPSLAGQTIALTRGELAIAKSLDIEGLGADQLTISGNSASRVFDVSAGVTVTLAGMTITGGLANGSAAVRASAGGGILNLGSLTLTDDVVSNNQAVGDPHASALGRVGGAVGGGLANLGTLIISGNTFNGNQALGADHSSGNSAGNAIGGAILTTVAASITDSQFNFNVAQAGSNCSGNLCASGTGGAIQNSGSLSVAGSTFSANLAIGGSDSSGPLRPGLGSGGAILSGGPTGPAAKVVITASMFDNNLAIGGNGNQLVPTSANPLSGPNEAFGGAIHLSVGSAVISGCMVEYNAAIGGSGGAGQDGGLAWGGGIDLFNAFGHGLTATVSNCTIGHNLVIGGTGGTGGNGGYAWGGGLANLLGATLTISKSTVEKNLAIGGFGGFGGNGGDGQGGGIFQDGNANSTLTLMGDTIDSNYAIGGAAGLGGSDGEGVGGGVYLTPGGVACADVLTAIFANHATTSDDDVFGTLGSC